MAVSVADFRSSFPEFSDVADYPDTNIQYWLDFEKLMFNEARWGDLMPKGVMLFAAHNLSLQRGRIQAAASGRAPGAATGVLSSKSVSKVSASYDVGVAAEEGAGVYNLTVYGQQYIHLARLIGAGPVQIGIPSAADILRGQGAYVGPLLP